MNTAISNVRLASSPLRIRNGAPTLQDIVHLVKAVKSQQIAENAVLGGCDSGVHATHAGVFHFLDVASCGSSAS
jgi:hypothetical protein